jgi:hypothetical protein
MSAAETTARQPRPDFTAKFAKSTKEIGALELWRLNFELCFIVLALIVAQAGKKQKPTVGFLARFFLEGLDRRLCLQGNSLR